MTPQIAAFISILIGTILSVTGVYVLAGLGWALVSAAPFFFAFAFLLVKGLIRE